MKHLNPRVPLAKLRFLPASDYTGTRKDEAEHEMEFALHFFRFVAALNDGFRTGKIGAMQREVPAGALRERILVSGQGDYERCAFIQRALGGDLARVALDDLATDSLIQE